VAAGAPAPEGSDSAPALDVDPLEALAISEDDLVPDA